MPLFEITPDQLRPLSLASLAEMKVRERDDLQRLLRTQIDVLGEDLYVVAEEFGDWEDSRRRIDLPAAQTPKDLQAAKEILDSGIRASSAEPSDGDVPRWGFGSDRYS